MPLVRMIVGWRPAVSKPEDVCTNTLYFNVSGSIEDPAYQDLADDVRDVYAGHGWTAGTTIEVRAYDMGDAQPRPERAFSTVVRGNVRASTASQVAVCLSYYADRNLPRQRGRVYIGPLPNSEAYVPAAVRTELIAFGQELAGIGGLNVDWSVYSPTTGDATRISNIWVDDSWDIVRSRKLDATARTTATING
jgi:hypothetical protein